MADYSKVNLRKDDEGVHAYASVPGAIVAATGDSLSEALAALAECLGEDDQPFWEEGEVTR